LPAAIVVEGATAVVPVRAAPVVAVVTVSVCDPAASTWSPARPEKPRPAASLSRRFPDVTAVAVDATEALEISDDDVARLLTLNVNAPPTAAAVDVAVATVGSDEVAAVACQSPG